jgi:hypothetical protein
MPQLWTLQIRLGLLAACVTGRRIILGRRRPGAHDPERIEQMQAAAIQFVEQQGRDISKPMFGIAHECPVEICGVALCFHASAYNTHFRSKFELLSVFAELGRLEHATR